MLDFIRLSSNTTLFWKLFLPTFWFAFYGSLMLVFWFGDNTQLGLFSKTEWKYGMTTFFVLGSLLLYFTVLKLHRVEYKDNNFYVSNYFRTIKVPLELALRISESKLFFFSYATLQLRKKTIMGRDIPFIFRRNIREEIRERIPGVLEG